MFIGSYGHLILMSPCHFGRPIITRAHDFVKGARTEKILAQGA
jgi:hypothetical protein